MKSNKKKKKMKFLIKEVQEKSKWKQVAGKKIFHIIIMFIIINIKTKLKIK